MISQSAIFLITLVMALLLLRSTAAGRFRMNFTAFNLNCKGTHQLPHVASMQGWTGRAASTRCINPDFYGELRSTSRFSPAGLQKLRTGHHFATLQSSNTNNASDDEQAKTKKRSPRSKQTKKKKSTGPKKLQRIDKILAHRGLGTRSETFELAKAKRITMASRPDAPHEERTRLRGPKEKIPYNASLFLDGNLLPGPPPLLLAYHKPKYVLSVMQDDKKYQDQQRKHLGQVLEPRYIKSGMHPVGRLDYDTTGLILFSLDGKLTQRLLHPRRGVEKEYVATVQGLADEASLTKKLSDGVETSEGAHVAELIAVTHSEGPIDNDDELEDVMKGDDDEDIQDDYLGPCSDVRLVVKEGKYRMVRRMLANCGHPVVELRRVRHGMVELGDLSVGEFREATEEETEWAQSLID